jgi:hypothetical protein
VLGMADYVRRQAAFLANFPVNRLLQGEVEFAP